MFGDRTRIIAIAILLSSLVVSSISVEGHVSLGEQGLWGPVEGTFGNSSSLTGHVSGDSAYVLPGSIYQTIAEQGNYYSPSGSIFVETFGDLTFAINISETAKNLPLKICLPPEFTPPVDWKAYDDSNVWTTITNDYYYVETGRVLDTDEFAPGWWYIKVSAPSSPADGAKLYPSGLDPFPVRQLRGMYYVCAKGMKAPSVAGRYFFKVFIGDQTIPPQNYPVLLVKAEVDPGYISGRVLYGGGPSYYGYYDQPRPYAYGGGGYLGGPSGFAAYGDPIWKPGKVVAEGLALDPVTNELTGRRVVGVGYFNSSANGFYEIEGLAPSVYSLTAMAAGFPPIKLERQVTVKRGQSVHNVDIYVYPGARISLRVNSKCPSGRVAWPSHVTLSGMVGSYLGYSGWPWGAGWVQVADSSGNVSAFVAASWGITSQPFWFDVFLGDPQGSSGAEMIWDGHVPDDEAHYVSGLSPGVYYVQAYVFGYVQLESFDVVVPSVGYTGSIYREIDLMKSGVVNATIHFHDQDLPSPEQPTVRTQDLALEAYDAAGNLRGWNVTTVPSGSKNMSLTLIGDDSSLYGMPEGVYTFKVHFPGYVQTEFPSHPVPLCSSGEFSFHLVKGANLTFTIYSRDWQSPATPLIWKHPNAWLRAYFYDSRGRYVGYRDLRQPVGMDSVNLAFWGLTYGWKDYVSYRYRSTGLPTDAYTVKIYTIGYIQREFPSVWVQAGSSTGDYPVYLYAGAEIVAAVNFRTEQLIWPTDDYLYARVSVFDAGGNLVGGNISAIPAGTRQYVFTVFGFGGFTTPTHTIGKHFAYYPPGRRAYLDYGLDSGTYTVKLEVARFEPSVSVSSQSYVQLAVVSATVSLMGRAELFFDMERLAHVSGVIYVKNWMGDYRMASWMNVLAENAADASKIQVQSLDGFYDFYAPPGTYVLNVFLLPSRVEGYVEQSRTLTCTWGAEVGEQNFYLEESSIPIYEFQVEEMILIATFLALFVLFWRRRLK